MRYLGASLGSGETLAAHGPWWSDVGCSLELPLNLYFHGWSKQILPIFLYHPTEITSCRMLWNFTDKFV
jgi:hypothetical protein